MKKLNYKITLKILRLKPFLSFVTFLALFIQAFAWGATAYTTTQTLESLRQGTNQETYMWIGIETALVLVMIFSLITAYILKAKLKYAISTHLRNRYVENISHMNQKAYNKTHSGKYLNDLTHLLTKIEEEYIISSLDFAASLIGLISSFIAIALINFYIGLILVVLLTLSKTIIFIFGKKLKKQLNKNMESKGEYNKELKDIINGARVLFWYQKLDMINEKMKLSNQKVQNSEIKYNKTAFNLNLSTSLVSWIFNNLLTFIVSIMIFKYSPSMIAIFMGVVVASYNFNQSLDESVKTIVSIRQTSTIRENYLFSPVIDSIQNIEPQTNNWPKLLEIKNVYFSYDTKELLSNLNFKIKPNDKIAIIGKNGSGKSTLIKLLTRQIDPNKGLLLYDKKNIKEYKESIFLSNFSYANNKNLIIKDTLANNLLLFSNGEMLFSFEKIQQMFNLDFTNSFNDILEPDKLSTGQKQRITLARVFLANKPIIILDECFSNLDKHNASQIFDTIISLKNKTIIIISHHLSSQDTAKLNQIIKL